MLDDLGDRPLTTALCLLAWGFPNSTAVSVGPCNTPYLASLVFKLVLFFHSQAQIKSRYYPHSFKPLMQKVLVQVSADCLWLLALTSPWWDFSSGSISCSITPNTGTICSPLQAFIWVLTLSWPTRAPEGGMPLCFYVCDLGCSDLSSQKAHEGCYQPGRKQIQPWAPAASLPQPMVPRGAEFPGWALGAAPHNLLPPQSPPDLLSPPSSSQVSALLRPHLYPSVLPSIHHDIICSWSSPSLFSLNPLSKTNKQTLKICSEF